MNIHLPAILMFTRGTRFWHTAKQEPIPTHPSPPGFFPGTGGVPPRTLDVFPFEQQLSKLQLAAKPRGPLTLSRTTAWPLCAWVPWLFGELVLESNHHYFGGTTLSNEAGFVNPALTSLVFISFIQYSRIRMDFPTTYVRWTCSSNSEHYDKTMDNHHLSSFAKIMIKMWSIRPRKFERFHWKDGGFTKKKWGYKPSWQSSIRQQKRRIYYPQTQGLRLTPVVQ